MTSVRRAPINSCSLNNLEQVKPLQLLLSYSVDSIFTQQWPQSILIRPLLHVGVIAISFSIELRLRPFLLFNYSSHRLSHQINVDIRGELNTRRYRTENKSTQQKLGRLIET